MVSFKSRKITNPPSLAEKLKQTRQNLSLRLIDIVRATNISLKYLSAIEAGKFDQLPGEVYARNFLKTYAKILKLDVAEVLSAYENEQRLYSKVSKKSTTDVKKPVERVSRTNLLVTPKIVRGAIVGALVIACLLYLGIKVQAIISPPLLFVEKPSENLVIANSFIEVAGKAEKETLLEINGQQVLTNPEGYFSELVDLQNGVNIIEIKAEKRHGTQTKIYRQVVVMDQNDIKEELIN